MTLADTHTDTVSEYPGEYRGGSENSKTENIDEERANSNNGRRSGMGKRVVGGYSRCPRRAKRVHKALAETPGEHRGGSENSKT